MTVCFELSTDPELLRQYYKIREQCFRRELGVRSFNGGEDQFDRTGKILVFKDGDRCIGGVRLSGSSATNPGLLPMEKNGFLILREFPEIARKAKGYCQWTRLALLPEFRTTQMLKKMTQVMIGEAINQGYSYSFGVSDLNRSRLYRRFHQAAGFTYEIRAEIETPEESGFVGLEHLLSIGYLEHHSKSLIPRGHRNLPRVVSSTPRLKIVA